MAPAANADNDDGRCDDDDNERVVSAELSSAADTPWTARQL